MTDVCVVGLGKIGLPLACAIASAGHRVLGADIDASVVAQVNAGIEVFPGEEGLADALRSTTASGHLVATTETAEAVQASSVVIVVVPLVVDDQARPDFAAIDAATAAVANGLRPGTLVSYETTLPIGTTRTRFAPALRAGSSLAQGDDLFVVHSPERVFSGRIFADLRRYPKLIGGIDAASARRGTDFYESFLDFDDRDDLARANGVWDLGSAEAAELAKLAETTYRDVNIAFANELAMASMAFGVDVADVIQACNSQPFSHIHQPGISVGGHCIPVYPHMLLAGAPDLRLVATAREVNDRMPWHAVECLDAALGGLAGRHVLVMGVAYRAGVKETAFSGAYALRDALAARKASVLWDDPLYTPGELAALGFEPTGDIDDVTAIIVHTAHEEYRDRSLDDHQSAEVIVDGRNSLDPARWPGVRIIDQVGHAARGDRA